MRTMYIYLPNASFETKYNDKTVSGNAYTSIKYPDGCRQVRLTSEAIEELNRADSVEVYASLTTKGLMNANIIDLILLTDAIQENFEGTLNLILPYLPYSRADRRFVNGDCHGLKVFGKIVDEMAYDRVITLDVHSSHARRLISNLLNVQPDAFIHRAIAEIEKKVGQKVVIVLPDTGASRYTMDFNRAVLKCSKERDAQTGVLSNFKVPDLKGMHAIIVDDICDGGATFLGIADKLKEQSPASKLFLYVTHGIFSKGFSELMTRFEHIYSTDSVYPHESYGVLTVYPASSVLGGGKENRDTEELSEQSESA